MRLPILMLAIALSGCGTRNASTAFADCDRPVLIPERDITRAEVVSLWGQDRAALITCRARNAAASGVDPDGLG